MAYVNVPKPTGASYTKVADFNPIYDNPKISYDEATYLFDGIGNHYTNISKPTGSVYTLIAKPT